ncbi:hypothetical protein FB45DRAFT_1035587 [Roridomyces roridus]|uniref:Uncharacterized protein n=1 Tax=Roridomyces roridus TaxID=1738132 RepID=A0AAD7B9J2_9AGAR|nr:hypothetical protein FB45DRAFT_1035587 [Roridomyces roridus]
MPAQFPQTTRQPSMSYVRTPNLTGRVRRASAPAITTTSDSAAPMVIESVAQRLRRRSLPLAPNAPSPSPSTTIEQGAALRRMAPRDPSPPLNLEPSFAEVGQLKRIGE